ncbi:MAG: ABC transporter ATP-binding protein/permease [Lachnospiraceae bacterium]|nr:ABC transporter ATP-binding protein/permease [Lachnospiraceae bacterium]
MKKNDSKITMRHKITNLRRGYQLCHELAPTYICRQCFVKAVIIVQQYTEIYLSGMVVSMITGENEFSAVTKTLAVYGLLCLIMNTLQAFVRTSKDTQLRQGFEAKAKMLLANKCAELDYARIEDPETHRRRQEAENYFYGTGSRYYGLKKLLHDTDTIFEKAFSIVIGLGVCFSPLFLKAPVEGAPLGFLQSPLGALLLLALFAVLIAVQVKTSAFTGKKWSDFYSDPGYNQEGRILGFYVDFFRRRYQRGKDVRLYDQSELLMKEWELHNEKYQSYGKRMIGRLRLPDMAGPVTQMLLGAIIYLFFIARAAGGMYTASETIVLVMSITKMIDSVVFLLEAKVNMGLAAANIGHIFDFLDIPDGKYRGMLPTEKRDDNEYVFEFRHVSFRYPGMEQYVLRDIDLTWRIGEKMALVGRNGSGKSTLVKLLCRLYDPTEGEITLNGIDIRKYNYEEYMALFSVVFQDSRLFAFSIAENVAADTEYDGALVEDCVRRAGLSERLDAMPEGIETCLYKDFDKKGVEISGGEAQKLCLARAIYKGTPFLILDEPTAALDPVSEHEIYTKFNSIVGTRTAIYISHRLSSCRFCDDITVLEDGRIVEKGSHEELLKKNGSYAALWSAQAEYYKDTAGELFTGPENVLLS